MTDQPLDATSRAKHRRLQRVLLWLLFAVLAYTALAYAVLPAFWTHHEHQKGLANLPMVTRTAQGIPGDPINVGLIGNEKEVLCAMNNAGWFPADPVTFRSSIEIAGSVLLDRAYHDAPVSPLFYLDRREDLAFEKPAGKSADRRHHVRFWTVLDKGEEQRPVWLGAVTFDKGVGVSHFTGAITHDMHLHPARSWKGTRHASRAKIVLGGGSAAGPLGSWLRSPCSLSQGRGGGPGWPCQPTSASSTR